MKKDELFKILKDKLHGENNSRIKPPGRMDLHIDNGELIMHMSKEAIIIKNMQENNSAFESWMLCIMSSKTHEIKRVVLKWDHVEKEEHNGHYHRFIYRVMKCVDYFGDWFKVDSIKERELSDFRELFLSTKLVLNYPDTEAKSQAQNEKSEAAIERAFFRSENIFKDVKFDKVGHQLPVGVFIESKSKTNAFFTSGHSAIDLWGIKNNELWIFELKLNNKMVGIITELLFYMWLCEDVFINGAIRYDINPPIPKQRNFAEIHKLYEIKAKSITGVCLYDEGMIHPLVKNTNVMEFLNKQFICKNRSLSIKEQVYRINDINVAPI